jgi:hypothetical protein
MKQSIKAELKQHVQDLIENGTLTPDNTEDWHQVAFSEDYYIIGYYNAEEWLKKHDVSAFEVMVTIVEYEEDNFGEVTSSLDNAESVVNMYVYILGEEIIQDAINELGEQE